MKQPDRSSLSSPGDLPRPSRPAPSSLLPQPLHFRMCSDLRFGVGSINGLAELLREPLGIISDRDRGVAGVEGEVERMAPSGPESGAEPSTVLVVTDSGLVKAGVAAEVTSRLDEAGIPFAIFDRVEPDPRVEIVGACVEAARACRAQALIGLGGGSPIDIAKVTAIMMTNGGEPLDYVGIGQVPRAGRPVVAIPTTAGTGSEVTPIAVLSDKAAQLKKGIVSDHLYPAVALIDPALMTGLPPRITAYTGMDALTHCIEAYTNRFAQPFIDVFAREGIRLIAEHLRTAFCHGTELAARTGMAMGSLYGGLCLGAVNTAAVHALAYPLGGTYDIPHGLANTVLLPYVVEFNAIANLPKYAQVAELLGERVEGLSPRASALAAVNGCRQLAVDLGMDLRLRDFGIPEKAIPEMAEAAMQVTRLLKNNPRTVTAQDCEAIYRKAW